MPPFRTQDQLNQAKWAERFLSVSNGRQYGGDNSPFPLHEYFRNKLLGKDVKMLEVNAGATIVDSFVADTMTDMTIVVGDAGSPDKGAEQAIWDWWNGIDYPIKLEEAMKNYFGAGFGLQMPVFNDGKVYVSNVDPSRWYPTLPVFDWQPVEEGKVITPFYEVEGGKKQWYAFVEEHAVGKIAYRLLKLESKYALEGEDVGLGSLPRFKGIEESADTRLETFDVVQVDRAKSSETLMGQSILCNVWDLLQEVSEAQTQIRHERIKHLKAKIYGSRRSFQKAQNVLPDPNVVGSKQPLSSKQLAQPEGSYVDMNQEILFVEDGIVPGYLQRDLESITKGLELIDDCLAKIAFTVGCPKSIFNIDEKAGNLKVDTEKRKDRKYVRQVLLAQRRASSLAVQMIQTWWLWTKGAKAPPINVLFASPFDLTREERVALMREMNETADFVSRKEAIKQIWTDKTPEERDELEKEIDAEQPDVPPTSQLSKPPAVQL
jgi:hypothetical protein